MGAFRASNDFFVKLQSRVHMRQFNLFFAQYNCQNESVIQMTTETRRTIVKLYLTFSSLWFLPYYGWPMVFEKPIFRPAIKFSIWHYLCKYSTPLTGFRITVITIIILIYNVYNERWQLERELSSSYHVYTLYSRICFKRTIFGVGTNGIRYARLGTEFMFLTRLFSNGAQ